MRIPGAERAFVAQEKVRTYLLDPSHPRGRNKARVFAATLGLTQTDSPILAAWLREIALSEVAETARTDEFGRRFVIRGEMEYNGQTALIRTAWIILHGEDFPRFVSAFVE